MNDRSQHTWVPTPTFLYRMRLYRKLIDGTQRKEFLDIGTGNGYLLKYLSDNKYKGTAMDVSKDALKMAMGFISSKNIKLKHADIYKVSTKRKYDQIFAFEILEHVPDAPGFIRQISKLLTPKGRVLLSVPAHMKDWNKIDEMKGHYHRYEKDELNILFENEGLKIIRHWSYGFPFLRILRSINSDAKFIQQNSKQQYKRTKESSIVREYNPKLKLLSNPLLWEPLFRIQDMFLSTDLGFGYLVEAVKIKKK